MKRATMSLLALLLGSSLLAIVKAWAEPAPPRRSLILFPFRTGPTEPEQDQAKQLTEMLQTALQATRRYEVLLFHPQAPLVRQALAQGTLTAPQLGDLENPGARLDMAEIFRVEAALSGEILAFSFISEPKTAAGQVEVEIDIQEVQGNRVVAFHAIAEAQARTPRRPSPSRSASHPLEPEETPSPDAAQRRAISGALAQVLVDRIEEFWPVLPRKEPASGETPPVEATPPESLPDPLAEARQRASVRDFEAASRVYTAAIVADPGNPSLYVELGDMLAEGGQWAQARDQYQRALRVDSRHRPAYRRLAEAWHQLRQPKEEIEAWKKLSALGEEGEEVEQALAEAYQAEGNYSEAVAHFERVLTLTADPYPLLLDLGRLAEEYQDLQAATMRYQAALELRPQEPSAHQHLLAFHLRHRQFSLALARLEELLGLPASPQPLGAELYLPVLHLLDREAGRLERRLEELRQEHRASASDPTTPSLEELDRQVQGLLNLANRIQPEEPYRLSYRHRILSYSLLGQAVVEYLSHLDPGEALSRERSSLLSQQARDELETAQDLERQVSPP